MGTNTIPAKEVVTHIGGLGRSELRLAAAEFGDAVSHLRAESKAFSFGLLTTALGLLPLMAFLVIGLGRLLGDNYWLSSLLVALVFLAVGGMVTYTSIQRIEISKLSFPRTRENLHADGEVVSKAIHLVKKGERS